MKIQSKTLGIAALVLAAVALGSLGIAALIGFASGGFSFQDGPVAGIAVDEAKSFPVEGIKRIRLGSSNTDILVVSSTGSAVSVRLHGTVTGSNMDAIPTLVAELSAGELSARVERNKTFWLGFRRETVVLEVGIPASYKGDLEADLASGDVTVRDHRFGELAVSTGSGDVVIEGLACGSVSAKTSSGDVNASAVEAKTIGLSSSSGDISARDLSGDLSVRSSSGDTTVSFSRGPGSSSIVSSSGDVTVTIPSSAEFSLDLRTSSGDISCDFPITIAQRDEDRHTLKGTVGNAAAGSLSVDARSGDVKVVRR